MIKNLSIFALLTFSSTAFAFGGQEGEEFMGGQEGEEIFSTEGTLALLNGAWEVTGSVVEDVPGENWSGEMTIWDTGRGDIECDTDFQWFRGAYLWMMMECSDEDGGTYSAAALCMADEDSASCIGEMSGIREAPVDFTLDVVMSGGTTM